MGNLSEKGIVMIKVVYVVPIIAPYAIPRYQELAKNKDIEVHVIAERDTNAERAGWHFQKIEGVKTYLLQGKITKSFEIKNRKDGYKMQKSRVFSTELRKKIKEIEPDVVLACNSTQLMLLLGQKRTYKLGVVVEDTLRAAEGRSIVDAFIKKMMLKTADFYLPFSDDAVAFLEANGIKGSFIRSTWSMDVDFFRDLSQVEIEKKKIEYGMIKKCNYVLVAGLIPRKGILQFLEAWKEMKIEFQRDSDLFILGDGILKNDICRYTIENGLKNVKLVGNKSYEEVSHYLQCGDVFVLPTLEDLCSLSVLEAMAAKKPVLTTVYNGARQFVKEGRNGYIFDTLNKPEVIKVLETMYQTDLESMSAASEEIVQNYSTKKVMENLAQELLKLCSAEQ